MRAVKTEIKPGIVPKRFAAHAAVAGRALAYGSRPLNFCKGGSLTARDSGNADAIILARAVWMSLSDLQAGSE